MLVAGQHQQRRVSHARPAPLEHPVRAVGVGQIDEGRMAGVAPPPDSAARYCEMNPPSITNSAPVTNAASSDAKNNTP